MNRRTTRSLAVTAAVVCAIGLVSACSGSKKKPVAVISSITSSATPTPTPAATTPKAVLVPAAVNYLNGVGAPSKRPVIAVKIDDTVNGRPQLNIDKADIVYIEQAEAGLTRLLAVYGTNYPSVGYVRSTRPSDPELLLQYGLITLAASGGGGDGLPLLDQSGIKGWINDRGAAYYARAPHDNDHGYVNVTLDLNQVAATAKTPAAKSIGFTWSTALGPVKVSGPGSTVSTTVGATPVDFRWNSTLRKYVRYIDGVAQLAADGNPITTGTVIVQACNIAPHYQDVDVNGQPTQYTTTIGKGQAVVFRDGKRINASWSRPSLASGTTLRDAAGRVIPLAPGGAWVALVATGTAVTSS